MVSGYGSGFTVLDLWFRFYGFECMVAVWWFRIYDSDFMISDLRFQVHSFGFVVPISGCGTGASRTCWTVGLTSFPDPKP